MFINSFFLYLKIWLIIEIINWFRYLFIYINIIEPKFTKFKKDDMLKIINRLDKLNKDEINYIISGCVIYDKITHTDIQIENFNIKNMTKNEIINLIGYSLFGLEISDIYSSEKYSIILGLVNKIESKLEYKFESSLSDRYLYRKWGSNFIKFSFRPLILQIPLKIFILFIHLLFTIVMGFTWKQINKIGFLTNKFDPNKKNMIFIHGFGFGYIPYFLTLIELSKKYNLIIMVLPNISSYTYYGDINYIYFPPLSLISSTLYNFLESNNINETILLAHSFGTYITQFIRTDPRNKIFSKIILVDPIIFWIGCFKMSLHVENPFIKKYPLAVYFIDNLLCFIIYQCLYLKYVCYRVMFGPDFWIYDASELSEHKNIIVVLEKNDYIIPAELIYNKIKNNVKCYYIDSNEFYHGTILMDTSHIQKLIEIIET